METETKAGPLNKKINPHNQESNNQQSMIEDLTVKDAEEVKGGPIEIREIPIRVRL